MTTFCLVAKAQSANYAALRQAVRTIVQHDGSVTAVGTVITAVWRATQRLSYDLRHILGCICELEAGARFSFGLALGSVDEAPLGPGIGRRMVLCGESVDMASSLAAVAVAVGAKVVASENLRDIASASGLPFRELDSALQLFLPDEGPDLIEQLQSEFALGREALAYELWEKATWHFCRCLELWPDDRPSLLALESLRNRRQGGIVPQVAR